MGCSASLVRPLPAAADGDPAAAKRGPGAASSSAAPPPPAPTAPPPEAGPEAEAEARGAAAPQRCPAAARAAAVEAVRRRRVASGAQGERGAGLRRLRRALGTLAQGRPEGLTQPPVALAEFLRTEGAGLGAAERERMREALAAALAQDAGGGGAPAGAAPPPGTVAEEGREQGGAGGAAAAGPDAESLAAPQALAWAHFSRWCTERLLLEAFRLVNLTKSARLTAQELMVLLVLISVQRKEGGLFNADDAEHIVQEFDLTCDGLLNEDEFMNMVHNLEREAAAIFRGDASLSPRTPAVEFEQPYLVLYFDVNNTVLIADTLTNASGEDLLSNTLAGCAWGIQTQQADGTEVWILVCPEPHDTPPWEGLISYAQFVVRKNPMPPADQREELEVVKDRRRTAMRSFCRPGQPGEALRPHLEKLLAELKRETEEQVVEGCQAGWLLQSFYFLLRQLKRAGRSFTVVFRTFGVDLDEEVQREFNAFCEGRHPSFPGGPPLDGSDGGPDHRIDLSDPGSVGTFFRSPGDNAISLVWGTREQPPPGQGLDFYEAHPGLVVHSGPAAAAQALEERVVARSQTVVLRDYYPGWARARFTGAGGKPIFLHIEDEAIFPVFFDDHIRPVDPTIVDVIDTRDYPQRVPMAQAYSVHLVRATALRSVMEPSYFWDEVKRCERAKRTQLLRRRKTASMLHDTGAIRAVIDLLRGPSSSPAASPVRSSIRQTMKFTTWNEVEAVRNCPPLSPEATEPPTPGSTRVCSKASIIEVSAKSTTELPVPVKQLHKDQQAQFLREEWVPFTDALQSHLQAVRERHAAGYSAHEVMFPQPLLVDLTQQCLDLTKRWHGRANVSAVYRFLMDAAEMDGHSPYLFADLPQQTSPDGYVRVLDGQVRRRLYTLADGGAKDQESLVGRVPQAVGESAIDNLVLTSLVPRRQALLLRCGRRIQQYFLRTLRQRQLRILEELGVPEEPGGVAPGEAERERAEEVRRILQLEAEVDSACTGGDDRAPSRTGPALRNKESLAYRSLALSGRAVRSYGQLPREARLGLEAFLAAELGAERPEDEPGEELRAFLAHCQRHPGRSFEGSPVRHKLMLLRAIASPAVRLLWRSELERSTQHRYFAVPWRRAVPLRALCAEGAEGEGGRGLATLRPAGAPEHTRFRKNVFAYGEAHGLGQGGGGCAEGPAWPPGSLMYELGTLLCVDERAKVPNHWVTDIEKVVRDARLLCPEGGAKTALPGEMLFDAGQNPVIASSIGPTQHVQTMRATVADFPLMSESGSPQWWDGLGAWVDIVQVGAERDAFFVQARSREPDAQPLLRFFIGLREHLIGAFGRGVDFFAGCHPSAEGEFLVVLAPVACIRRIRVPKGEGCMGQDFDFENPDTGERVTQHRLPVASVDCSHGKGNILAFSDEFWRLALEGRPMLARLYDFNRRPGARAAADAYLRGGMGLLARVAVRPHGVLGLRLAASGREERSAPLPGPKTAVLSPLPARGTAPGGAAEAVGAWLGRGRGEPPPEALAALAAPGAWLEELGGRRCLHVAAPELRGRSCPWGEAAAELAAAYAAALAEFAASGLGGLRLLPLSGGPGGGGAALPDLTAAALQQALARLDEAQRGRLAAASLELCVYAEAEQPAFAEALRARLASEPWATAGAA